MVWTIALFHCMSVACLSQAPSAQPQQAGPTGRWWGGGRGSPLVDQKFITDIRSHVGGNPGRHENHDTRELNDRFIANVIGGDNGYVEHQYSPALWRYALASLRQTMEIMQF